MFMIIRNLLFVTCLGFIGVCNCQINKPVNSNIPKQNLSNNPNILSLKDKIKGIWTDGNSENASFVIKENTIYNVDHSSSVKYELLGNKIKIKYVEGAYTSTISFQKDTLIFTSDGVSTKYWKFKK